MNSVLWASCWLAPPNKILNALVEIQTELARKGIEIVLFGDPSIKDHYPSLLVIDTPFHNAEVGRRYSSYASAIPHPQSSLPLAELMQIDRAWGLQLPDLEAELLIMRANAFWEKAFAVMQPSVILSWGATAPMARMMFNIARRYQRPAFVIERGLLEDTLSYSLVGQGMLSNFNTSLSLVDPNLEDPDILNAWEEIEDYYEGITERHYPDINREPDEAIRSHFANDAYPRVLYLGSHDIGSGAALDHETLGDLQGTWINSSGDGALALQSALDDLGFQGSLWIKPHGASYFDVAAAGERPYSTTVMANIDVYSLISNADVCVTLTSSTQILSLIKGKPVVTLGNGQFTGRDIFYEAPSYSTLVDALKQALARQAWEERLNKGKALLAAGYRETHVGLTALVPTRFKLSDFSELLSRFCLYAPQNLPSAKTRIEDFANFCASAFDQQAHRNDPGRSNPFLITKKQEKLIREITEEICSLRDSIAQRDETIKQQEELISLSEAECRSSKIKAEAADRDLNLIKSKFLDERTKAEHFFSENAWKEKKIDDLNHANARLMADNDIKTSECLALKSLVEDIEGELRGKDARRHVEKAELRDAFRKFVSLSILNCGTLPGLRSYRQREFERILTASGLIDEEWYASTYLAAGEATSAVKHFITHGLNLGTSPNKLLK